MSIQTLIIYMDEPGEAICKATHVITLTRQLAKGFNLKFKDATLG